MDIDILELGQGRIGHGVAGFRRWNPRPDGYEIYDPQKLSKIGRQPVRSLGLKAANRSQAPSRETGITVQSRYGLGTLWPNRQHTMPRPAAPPQFVQVLESMRAFA